MRAPHEDTLECVLHDAQDVQWATLRGAYGASDATDHYRDVPRMLMALANVDDTDSATWGDAYDDFFLAHVWHQFTIYPVTPVATGFLIRIASLRSPAAANPATQIAVGLRLVAETAATFRKNAEPATRDLGELTAAAFIAHRDYVTTWLSRLFEEHARAIGSCIPEMNIEPTVQPPRQPT